MKPAVLVLGWIVGAFLVVRAIAEPMSDSSTYEKDWGGPTLAGVLFVHCVPGIIAAVLMVRSISRRREARRIS